MNILTKRSMSYYSVVGCEILLWFSLRSLAEMFGCEEGAFCNHELGHIVCYHDEITVC